MPPPPPPGYAPPAYGSAPGGYQAAPSSAGIDRKTGTIIAYVLGWVTGLVMLFVGKNDPDVRFHAAQSIVFFGGLVAIEIIVSIASIFLAAVGHIYFLGFINTLINLFGFIMWIVIMVRAVGSNGERFDLPLVGGVVRPYAEQLANAIR